MAFLSLFVSAVALGPGFALSGSCLNPQAFTLDPPATPKVGASWVRTGFMLNLRSHSHQRTLGLRSPHSWPRPWARVARRPGKGKAQEGPAQPPAWCWQSPMWDSPWYP